jgi:hypothetical protein
MKYILSKFFLIKVLDENDPELKKPSQMDINNRILTETEKKQIEEVLERHKLKNYEKNQTLKKRNHPNLPSLSKSLPTLRNSLSS